MKKKSNNKKKKDSEWTVKHLGKLLIFKFFKVFFLINSKKGNKDLPHFEGLFFKENIFLLSSKRHQYKYMYKFNIHNLIELTWRLRINTLVCVCVFIFVFVLLSRFKLSA
jgi:hypothetical protein